MAGIDGPAIPIGGAHAKGTLQGVNSQSIYNPTPILPGDAVGPAQVAGSVLDGSTLPYLTPDAMLVYCQSRLNGIDTQCHEIMSRQETNSRQQAALGELLTALNPFENGIDDKNQGQLQTVRDAYDKAIAAVGPDTELGKKLDAEKGKLGDGAKGDIDGLITGVKNHQSQLNSDAEIDMIRLQSLMSQRQTAVQLTTNIVQSLNDQANKIVANIGH